MAGPPSKDNEFFPRGAVAFFATMILVYAALWVVMYTLMAGRG
jgi:hypothetical protein